MIQKVVVLGKDQVFQRCMCTCSIELEFKTNFPQVVVGVLGCPNLPAGQIEDADGAGNSAAKAGTDGVGVIFAARKGAGAFAGPLAGAAPFCCPPEQNGWHCLYGLYCRLSALHF